MDVISNKAMLMNANGRSQSDLHVYENRAKMLFCRPTCWVHEQKYKATKTLSKPMKWIQVSIEIGSA